MNCIVVDDEPLARKGMQMLIEQLPSLNLLGLFANALEADAFMRGKQVDIVFLDIQMPHLNGMELIKSSNCPARVIITTAYPQFAVEAFELEVADYLVKPIRFERFFKAVSKISQGRAAVVAGSESDTEDYIFIRTDRKYVRAHYREIDFIEGLKDYVIVHCGNERHIVATNLKTIYSGLPAHLFLRVNKSFIINMSKIKSIDNECILINSKSIPIGENFKKGVFDFISQKKILRRN
jgi:DNA-binding LytR/AlgR family response regulator